MAQIEQASRLVNVLGGFIDNFTGPQLPVRQLVHLVGPAAVDPTTKPV
jgi:hypothetical protein